VVLIPSTTAGDFLPLAFGSVLMLGMSSSAPQLLCSYIASAAFSYRAAPLDTRPSTPSTANGPATGPVTGPATGPATVPATGVDFITAYRKWNRPVPDLFGVYIPSSPSLRMSSTAGNSAFPATTPVKASLQRNATSASRATNMSIMVSSARDSTLSHMEVSGLERLPSRRGTRHHHVRQFTPEVTPVTDMISSVASIGEAPWRKSAGWPTVPIGGPILRSQVAYADQLAQDQAAEEAARAYPVPPPRLRLTIPGSPVRMLPPAPVPATERPQSLSPNSAAVYGSDIVRPGRGVFNRMRSLRRSPADDDGRSMAYSAMDSAYTGTRALSRYSGFTEASRGVTEDASRFGTPRLLARRPTDASVYSVITTYSDATRRSQYSDARARRQTLEEVFSPPLPLPSGTFGAPFASSQIPPVPPLPRPTPRVTWLVKGPRAPPSAYIPTAAPERRRSTLVPVREETPTKAEYQTSAQ
jgi:hypothetical protein